MASNQLCVFCGKRPEKKNREHILPKWLIKLTGSFSRVVNLGLDQDGKAMTFSWSSFVAPACEMCNTEYGKLEGDAKPLVQKLIARKELIGTEYVRLLDWLDRTRICLWLAYHRLQKNPLGISPRFHIDSRIATKDRMLAIYLMQTDNKGMNLIGVESPVFHCMPSCFMLNLNNVAILNMSCDYLCAEGCGFPTPKVREWLLDEGGMLAFDEFAASKRATHPVLNMQIFKPSICLYQPIMQRDVLGESGGTTADVHDASDEFLSRHTIPSSPHQGVLFRQNPLDVTVIADLDSPIPYAPVSMSEARPLYQLAAQTYDLQNYCLGLYNSKSSDGARLEGHNRVVTRLARLNRLRKGRIIKEFQQGRDAWT